MLASRRTAVAILVLTLAVIPFLVVFAVPTGKAATGNYSWPSPGPIIRGFEKPTGPYGEGGHQGVDIAAQPGDEVRAAKEGRVVWVGELPRGRFVSISHAGGVRTTYLDLESVNVSMGEPVSRCQVIGTVCGTGDGSSARPHLHFDTYLNGTPVDPCLLLRGFDAGSFVRLCPVKRTGGSGSNGAVTTNDQVSLLPDQPSRFSPDTASAGHRSRGLIGAVTGFFSSAWRGTCALACWMGRGSCSAWTGGIYPALRGSCRGLAGFASWAWGNRYVRAVTVGLAAAAVVVLGVIIAFILLPISAVVAAVAAVAGGLACIGMAIYYAATSGADFSTAACFFKSLSAGAAVATAVTSWGVLSAVAEAGWASAGLSGTCKAMFTNGLFSTIFDTCINYLFTGRISLRSMLIAFAAGAVTGGIGKVLRGGMMEERLIGLFSVAQAESASAVSLSSSAAVMINEATVKIQLFLVTCKELALTFGGKVAYVAFSGSLTAGINILSCVATHRPVTFSGIFASFLAGAAMGGLALSFGGEGLSGLLSRFQILRHGMGISVRRFLVKVINKGISKSLKNGFENLFKKVLKEEEVSP
jgi:Peptidase family M23